MRRRPELFHNALVFHANGIGRRDLCNCLCSDTGGISGVVRSFTAFPSAHRCAQTASRLQHANAQMLRAPHVASMQDTASGHTRTMLLAEVPWDFAFVGKAYPQPPNFVLQRFRVWEPAFLLPES